MSYLLVELQVHLFQEQAVHLIQPIGEEKLMVLLGNFLQMDRH